MPSHLDDDEDDKPCRACTDFKSWAKNQKKSPTENSKQEQILNEKPKNCPLDKEEIGSATWGFLHTMAAYFPDKPTRSQCKDITRFFNIFAQFYPCEPCALDFQEDIKQNPVQAKSRTALEQWLCERHNTVNEKLGKPQFDCSKVHERWKTGWADGSCDE